MDERQASSTRSAFGDARLEDELAPHSKAAMASYFWTKIVKRKRGLTSFSGSRPPNAVVRVSAAAASGVDSGQVNMARDDDLFYAVPDWWNQETDKPGEKPKPDKYETVYRCPAFASASSALEWFISSDAKAWKDDGESFTLLAFARLTQYSGPPLDHVGLESAKLMTCGDGGFPNKQWRPAYVAQTAAVVAESHALIDESKLLTLLDSDFAVHRKTDLDAECVKLGKRIDDERTSQREGEIRSEVAAWAPIGAKMADAIGLKTRGGHEPDWLMFLSWLSRATSPIIYKIKCRHNGQRPRNLHSDLVRPMFEPDTLEDADHPGHASFPAGHAATAALLTGLLASLDPSNSSKKKALDTVACRVGVNREIAGLHFPADTAAGAKLGAALASMILDPAGAPSDTMRANRVEVMGLLRKLHQP